LQDTVDHLNGDETESKDVTSVGSRHSLGESSVDGSRSFTPQSDSRSYRDRLRDRFQAVRVSWYLNPCVCFVPVNVKALNHFLSFGQERAGTSVVQMHSRSRMRRLNQPSTSRVDDLVSRILFLLVTNGPFICETR
jgi:hypothetical protein